MKLANLKSIVAIILLIFISAAASFNGFYNKWAFREDSNRFSIAMTLDGTAEKPFIYRQMTPAVANAVDRITPESVKDKIHQATIKNQEYWHIKAGTGTDKKYSFRYFIVFYFTFAAYILTGFAGIYLLRAHKIDILPASLASAAFVLIYPFFQVVGGQYYDMWEVCFMFFAVGLAISGNWIFLPLFSLIATYNKESFLLFLPILLPYVWFDKKRIQAFAFYGLSGIIALAVNLIIKAQFANNLGQPIEFHLWENLAFYANPINFLRPDVIYNIKAFPAIGAVGIVLIVWLFFATFKSFKLDDKLSFMLACLINIPLFVIFCSPLEGRNLSFIFPFLLLAMAFMVRHTLNSYIERTTVEIG